MIQMYLMLKNGNMIEVKKNDNSAYYARVVDIIKGKDTYDKIIPVTTYRKMSLNKLQKICVLSKKDIMALERGI